LFQAQYLILPLSSAAIPIINNALALLTTPSALPNGAEVLLERDDVVVDDDRTLRYSEYRASEESWC
jgi:hypothetical protein